MGLRTACVLALSLLPLHAQELSVETESYSLANGLRVTLHVDSSLPQVVINTWVGVGSRDEPMGRTGFAHLFEHLMFMGTERVPGSQFDLTMEAGGGFNNASTSRDRTNYFSVGPSALLPTLLWLDGDRFDALSRAMTQEKLDTQRGVVRNERRQTGENVPYARGRYLLSEMLYPKGHPYHHPVIGSHADLEAAQLSDVVGFFERHYVPSNCSLVVAGDFDPALVRPLIERTFGAVGAGQKSWPTMAEPPVLSAEVRGTTYDAVELEQLTYAWIAPAFMSDGDGMMDLLAGMLAGGPQTRLEKRLVIETGLAVAVDAYQSSSQLSSEFKIQVWAAPGADRAEIEREVDAVLAEYVRAPLQPEAREAREAELDRVRVSMERSFLERMQSLQSRADDMNRYLHYWGVADGFARDLARWTEPNAEDVRRMAATVLGRPHATLWVLPAPEGAEQGVLLSPLDERPADFERAAFAPPTPTRHELSNGLPVYLLPRPGSRLFSGALLSVRDGASAAAPPGADALAARMLLSGANGRGAVEFADALSGLGAELDASTNGDVLELAVQGLSSRLAPTLELFADAALAPNWSAEDFEREHALQLSEVRSRADDARQVSRVVARRLVYPDDDPRAHPSEGYEHSLEALQLDAVRTLAEARWAQSRNELCFAGDFDVDELLGLLEARFGSMPRASAWSARPSLSAAAPGRMVLVDRPGAPQTRLYLLRTIAPTDELGRAQRTAVDVTLGGSFTSRLNMKLREELRISYGASSALVREGGQELLLAATSVQTDATGQALSELMRAYGALGGGDLSEGDLAKSLETARTDAMRNFGTNADLLAALVELRERDAALGTWSSELAALGQVDLAGANAMARSGLYAWEAQQVVLVGDGESVRAQLAERGLPAPELVDAEGRPLE